jgi:hypothetical protein
MWKRDLLFIALLLGSAITLGASLIPPRQPAPVRGYNPSAWSEPSFQATLGKLDATFQSEWDKHKLSIAKQADDLTIARRLAMGLMGTIPSLEEIRKLESLQQHRLSWWIDHILADRRFADYLAERFARAYVGTEDGPFILYRRRKFVTWLGDKLADNVPYDRLVRELIATEGLWTDRPATNFLTVTSQKDKQNQPDPVRLAGRVTRAFLGIRLDCAECHNHPYASWKQSDFRGLAAFFGQAHLGLVGIYDGEGDFEVPDKATQQPKVIEPKVPFGQEYLPEEGSRRQRLADWVTNPKNSYFARATVNRVWAVVFGRALVDPVDNLEAGDNPENLQPPHPALQVLAADFVEHGYDLRRLIRLITASRAFRLESVSEMDVGEKEEKAWAIFPMTRLRPEQVVGAALQSSQLATIDTQSHLLIRLVRFGNQNDFVKRYGDSGEDEFNGRGGTIPQRLLMMNGDLIAERIKEGPFNASTRISTLAPDDPKAIEATFLAVLTRRPTPQELEHFLATLTEANEVNRADKFNDIYWALLNSTEFSWNH